MYALLVGKELAVNMDENLSGEVGLHSDTHNSRSGRMNIVC